MLTMLLPHLPFTLVPLLTMLLPPLPFMPELTMEHTLTLTSSLL
jgi:hypothetical protein